MPEIFIIGKEAGGFAGALEAEGFGVKIFDSPGEALSRIAEARLLIIAASGGESMAELKKASKNIPKLLISGGAAMRRPGAWLRQPFAFSLHEPSEKDVLYLASRILREKQRCDELRQASSVMKEEIGFYEEITRKLTSFKDFGEVLVMIMRRAREMTGAEAWSIILKDDDGNLIVERAEGKVKKRISKIKLKPGEGIAGWVAGSGKPLVVPDVARDKRFSPRVDRKTGFSTRSVIAVPVTIKGKVLGVLEVINKSGGGAFTDEDLAMLAKLVSHASLALEKVSLYQKMEELVITDDLTNLFNMRYLNRSIETEVLRSNRYHTSVSAVFMDIDYFKKVNDTHGHLVGSKVLVEMGQILIDQLRSLDIVGRYGGDEFVIVLPQTSPANAVKIAERLRKAVERHTFLTAEDRHIKITASFGVAAYPDSAKSKDELLRLADEAMYYVKRHTRNGVHAIIQ